ncbi:hypothetical protein NQZ68_000762 [Dissostichus eleginoides]|nr:hypothetical protein NQZ68_000762 [Dissostichus eleginoides]
MFIVLQCSQNPASTPQYQPQMQAVLTGLGSPDPAAPIPPPFSSRNTTGEIIWRGIKPSVERQVSFSEQVLNRTDAF